MRMTLRRAVVFGGSAAALVAAAGCANDAQDGPAAAAAPTAGGAAPAGAALRPAVAAVAAASPASAPAGAAPIRVKLIGFNDYHGHLQSPGTFGANTFVAAAERPAVGGAEYLAAHVARMKAQNPFNVVVGAGDFIGASPLISGLFFDEPAVETLNHIGVEFNAVGNHEFDKGAAELLRLQAGGCRTSGGRVDPNSCKGLGSAAPGRFDGAAFQWLSANVVETATGRTLLPAYGVKRFGGIDVAFIGMTLRGTPRVVTPSGVAGLEFRDEAETVNALVPQLRARGIEAIVALVHQGGVQPDPSVVDINGCDADLQGADGRDSEIGRIVRRLDDAVDLVISGHTHAAYNCSVNSVDVRVVGGRTVVTPRPTGLRNRAGRPVPVTSASAFGRLLTEVDLTLDPATHDVTAVSPHNRLVDRADPAINASIAARPQVRAIVAGYDALAAPLANRVVGRIAVPLSTQIGAAGEMAAGALIADAQLRATQPAAQGGAQIALTNPGGVRHPGLAPAGATYPYAVSFRDAFATQPFGNHLVTLTVSAQRLKDLLEQQFPGCRGQTTQRVLQVSNGLRYSWSAAAAPCAKIVELSFTPTDLSVTPPVATGPVQAIVKEGRLVDPRQSYRITVNSFMAAGGDALTALQGGTDARAGIQDVDALAAYLAAGYAPPRAPYDPRSPAHGFPRVVRLP